MIKRKAVFKDFHEYWYYARYLSEYQRDVIYSTLSKEEQKKLNDSFNEGEWNDVFYRNKIDKILDDMKDRYGYDVVNLRAKVMRGKSVYIPTKFWEVLMEQLTQYREKDIKYVISNISANVCKENKNVTLLVFNCEK